MGIHPLNLIHDCSCTYNIWVKLIIITHLAGQTYVWHGCKWNFAGPQIYLQPAKIKSQHFGVSLKFLVWNWKSCIWRLKCVKIFHLKCVYIGQPVSEISEFLTAYIHKRTVKTIVSYNTSYSVEVNSQKWVIIVIMFIFERKIHLQPLPCH